MASNTSIGDVDVDVLALRATGVAFGFVVV